ncbi:hypothetical protein NQZ68_020651 [Dissostichus eleginoides]|nr:hypothetical protein NQZ68_020651 [Dissostichus eleginoides]
MDLAPVGRSGLQCSQTKPLQQDPDTLTQKRGATEGEERRKGGDKVTRGEKMEKGREGAMGEALCGSSCSPKHAANPARSLLPLALSQQPELLGIHECFFHLAVLSLLPLHGPFPRSEPEAKTPASVTEEKRESAPSV